jgi:hypothetical protein
MIAFSTTLPPLAVTPAAIAPTIANVIGSMFFSWYKGFCRWLIPQPPIDRIMNLHPTQWRGWVSLMKMGDAHFDFLCPDLAGGNPFTNRRYFHE